MKKFFLFILPACILLATASAQSCLPLGIMFQSQEQIDSFQKNYPNCKRIEGSVILSGEGITNVNGLSQITAIKGNLWVGGWIYSIPDLYSLKGFKNLVFVGGSLRVDQCMSLVDLSGLEKLTSIGGELNIGLSWSKSTKSNCSLTHLYGLDNLYSVGKSVSIMNNYKLKSLEGLENLTTVGGDVIIIKNRKIENLDPLQNLTSVNGDIEIRKNVLLENIEGISNIEPGNIQNLMINNNPSLTFCEADFICDYISDLQGGLLITNNADGCNDADEVMEACGGTIEPNSKIDANIFSSYPNPFSYSTTIVFGLESPTKLQLIIINYLGQTIQIDEFSLNEGNHEIIWEAVGLPYGVYYCTLKTETNIRTIKMLKMR